MDLHAYLKNLSNSVEIPRTNSCVVANNSVPNYPSYVHAGSTDEVQISQPGVMKETLMLNYHLLELVRQKTWNYTIRNKRELKELLYAKEIEYMGLSCT